MLSIYSYENSHKFLKDAFIAKQAKNPEFSLRSWARNMGLSGHSFLQRVLAGKKKVPAKYVPFFIKSLNLSVKEGIYLDALVKFEGTEDVGEKEVYLQQMKEISPKKEIKFQELEVFKYLENPLHVLLMEMIDLKNFKHDLKWIKEKFILKLLN